MNNIFIFTLINNKYYAILWRRLELKHAFLKTTTRYHQTVNCQSLFRLCQKCVTDNLHVFRKYEVFPNLVTSVNISTVISTAICRKLSCDSCHLDNCHFDRCQRLFKIISFLQITKRFLIWVRLSRHHLPKIMVWQMSPCQLSQLASTSVRTVASTTVNVTLK